MDVLVTDHHRPGGRAARLPDRAPGAGRLPVPELCAAGVALKLSEALRARAGLDPAGRTRTSTWPALATVCDMVPLRGENRRIVREGLRGAGRAPASPGCGR